MGLSNDALTGLYSHESSNLKRFLTRKLGNSEDAEDVMQEAYVRMLCGEVQEPALRCAKAFLFTVASNLAIDSIRRKHRERAASGYILQGEVVAQGEQLDLVCPKRATDLRVDDLARLEDVLQSLDTLPRKCGRAFFMHKFMDLSYAEVAHQLGVTVSMVEKYLSQALHHVRTQPFAPSLEFQA